MSRRGIVYLIAAVSLVLLIGAIVGVASDSIWGDKDGSQTTKEEAAQKRHADAWRSAVKGKMSKKSAAGAAGDESSGEGGATEVQPDATRIIKTEMINPAQANAGGGAMPPEAAQSEADQKYLKVYLDNGQIEQIGPFRTKPRRIELVAVEVEGQTEKILVVEE